jgi:hypothetical protein
MRNILFCFLIFNYSNLFSQGFTLEIPSPLENTLEDIIETFNGDYIAIEASSGLNYFPICTQKLIKISHLGQILSTRIIEPKFHYKFSRRTHFVKKYPKNLGVFFHATLNDSLFQQIEKRPYFARFDENLNMLWDTIAGDSNIVESRYDETIVGDTIYFLGGIYSASTGGSLPYDFTPTISKVDFYGKVHETSVLSNMKNKLIFNESIVSSGDNLFLHSVDLDSFIQVKRSNIYNAARKPLKPSFNTTISGTAFELPNEKYILSAGNGYVSFAFNPPKFLTGICLLIRDSTGLSIDTIRLAHVNQFKTSLGIFTVDAFDENHIFVAGFEPTTPSYPTSDWLCVYSIGIDKTVNWQRFINYGKFLYPYRVKATSDGGVLVVGYTYKPSNQTPGDNDGDRNSLILKFDGNGDLVTNTNEPTTNFVSKPILVLPNPSAGRYEIKLGMFQNVEYQIFDITGRLVAFDKNNQEIDLSNQSNGAYICNFYSNGKFIMTEKLIKQSH